MADNKMLVYYGSYTLKYWLELILNEDISLPPYQRSFVWNPNMVIDFYDTLRKKYYVPPVLIANYNNNASSINLILDGQQRLTSILLCFLGIYPKIGDKSNDEKFELRWNINEIVKLVNGKYKGSDIFDKREIIRKEILETKEYLSIDGQEIIGECQDKNKGIIKEILKTNNGVSELYNEVLIGYSYVKFIEPDEREERKAYASIFKMINTSGKTLSALESRRSLYWIGENPCINEQFFEPEFTKRIFVQGKQLDFTELLSYVAEFNHTSNYNIAVGYKIVEKREKYFEDFIDAALFSQVNDKKRKLDPTFGNLYQIMSYDDNYNLNVVKKDIDERFKRLEELYGYIKEKNKIEDESYKNRVVPQIYFFGAIHYIVFKGKKIDLCCQLIDDLNAIIKNITMSVQGNKGKVEYNTLSSIRDRLKKSIEGYKKYVL